MLLLALVCRVLLTASLILLVNADRDQTPISFPEPDVSNQIDRKQVAIIGAGIAGASTAYFLQELARQVIPIDITIYESDARFGGRVKSFPIPEIPRTAIEVGASRFSRNDWCLMKAMNEVGLKEDYVATASEKTFGVWNGEELILVDEPDLEPSTWWDIARSIWKYGFSAWRFRQAVSSNLDKFEGFAEARSFNSLIAELQRLDVAGLVLGSSEQYLQSLNITRNFQSEIVQTRTRARFAQNLNHVRGLASLIAMRTSNTTSVRGGNYRLIERLIKLSEVDLQLNSRVKTIRPGKLKRYELGIEPPSSDIKAKFPAVKHAEYDTVIITAPFHFNGITLDGFAAKSTGPLPSYIEAHVTHFSSSSIISPAFFNLPLNTTIPAKILTTSTNSHSPRLFSITTDKVCYRRGCGPRQIWDERDWEYLYEILSANPMADDTIARMVGQQQQHREGADLADCCGISWVHRQAWPHAFPQYRKRQLLLDEIELAPDLFYTSAGEDVVSSLEMSCRMGYNTAEKIYWHNWR